MARANLSLPHERRKAALRSQEITLRVRMAETKQRLASVRSELSAMRPKPKKQEV